MRVEASEQKSQPSAGLWQRVLSAFTSTPPRAAITALPPLPKENKDRPRRLPIGGAGTLISAGTIDDVDANTEVRGDKWYGAPGRIGLAQKMMRDPHARRSVASRIAPVVAATWAMRPYAQTAIDAEVADYVAMCLFELLNWRRAVRLSLNFHRDGFSLLELTDDMRDISTARFPNHPGRGRGVVFTGCYQRPAWTLHRWIQSEEDPTQIAGIEQYLQGSDGEQAGFRVIPASRLLRFTLEQEGANFAGLATLRSAYGAFKTKVLLSVLDAIRHERAGVGIPRLTLPEGLEDQQAEVEKAETILAELRSHEKGYLILPNGYEFKWESVEGHGTAIGETIERCNRDISFNTGAGFTLLGLTGNSSGGSYALAQTQVGQHELAVEDDAAFLASVWNQGSDGWSPIERLVRMNYGPDVGIPKLVAANLPTRDWVKVMPVVIQLVNAGVLSADDTLEVFARHVLNLPERDEATTRPIAVPGARSPDEAPAAATVLPLLRAFEAFREAVQMKEAA